MHFHQTKNTLLGCRPQLLRELLQHVIHFALTWHSYGVLTALLGALLVEKDLNTNMQRIQSAVVWCSNFYQAGHGKNTLPYVVKDASELPSYLQGF
jgi:hypothetical protein